MLPFLRSITNFSLHVGFEFLCTADDLTTSSPTCARTAPARPRQSDTALTHRYRGIRYSILTLIST